MTANFVLSMSKSATECYSESGREPRKKIDGEDFVVAKESDIMGVVEEAASPKAA